MNSINTASLTTEGMKPTNNPAVFYHYDGQRGTYYHLRDGDLHPMTPRGGGVFSCYPKRCDPIHMK